jgi:ParB family transcriptional regulator, chromosome partitioning protein
VTLPLDGLDLLAMPTGLLAGAPLRLPIDAIDEDPDQPRREFDSDGLAELAETIKERGVRQPISVRLHPEQSGRWMLNFGARRLRASKLAGQADIPAFVDNSADSYDQVIENEQRENLKALELALFVQRRLAAKESQAEIARRLGKSRGYVTFICALIDAPDWLMNLYRSGRCRGIAELYELRRLHESEPDAVERWLAREGAVTRSEVQALKEALKPVEQAQPDRLTSIRVPAVPPASIVDNGLAPGAAMAAMVRASVVGLPVQPGAKRPPPRSLVLVGEVEGIAVRVLLDSIPDDGGQAFVVDADDTSGRPVPIASIAGLRLEERQPDKAADLSNG